MSLELRILEALERFRFLTLEQMRRAGVACGMDHLGELVRRLRARGQIGCIRPGVSPETGRIRYVYYLLKPGAESVAEATRRDLEALVWCHNEPKLSHDLAHRLACVDVHIWLMATLGDALAMFLPYYTTRREGKHARPSSRLEFNGKVVIPDALVLFERHTQRLGYVFEYQREKRSDALRGQVEMYAHVARESVAAKKLGVEVVAIMFIVQEKRDLEVIRATAATLAPLRGVLYGRTLHTLESATRFADGWEALA